MLRDLRCWLRIMRRNPVFPAVVIPTLALGIGATTALFSVVDAVLLRPLPFPEPERVVVVWDVTGSSELATLSVPDYLDLRGRLNSFERFEIKWGSGLEYEYTGLLQVGEASEIVPFAVVSSGFFSTLGVKPLLGQDFDAGDERQNAASVILISHALWKRRFGAAPDIIGKQVKFDGLAATIRGVLPPMLEVPARCEVWTNARLFMGSDETWRTARVLRAFGRLKRGTTLRQAQGELEAAIQNLPLERIRNTRRGLRLVPLKDVLVGNSRASLWAILAATIVLLLIACSNVANLSLGMTASRGKEMAVRAAAGATPWQLTRQSLIESTALSAAAGACGFVAAYWGLKLLPVLSPVYIPRLGEAGLNYKVFAFTLLTAVASTILFGLGPAIAASRVDLRSSLAEAGRGAVAGRRRAAAGLVVAETALALVAAVGATLVVRSYLNLVRVQPGFAPQGVVTAGFFGTSDGAVYSPESLVRILERIRAIPGVEAAAVSDGLPLLGAHQRDFRFTLSATPSAEPSDFKVAARYQVSNGYFRAMGIPLLRGRDFTEKEGGAIGGYTPIVVVNEELARRYFAGQDPLGRNLYGPVNRMNFEIVGIVGNVRHHHLWDPPQPAVYRPTLTHYFLIVRSRIDPLTLAAPIRAAVKEADPNWTADEFKTMQEIVAEANALRRFLALLLGWFGVASLGLAATGVYGVVSTSVKRRLPEFAVRAAVGARPAGILFLILRDTLRLAAAGVGAGVVAVLAVGRWLASLLFEVSPADPWSLGFTALAVMLVALAAALGPARAATRVDLMTTLGTG